MPGGSVDAGATLHVNGATPPVAPSVKNPCCPSIRSASAVFATAMSSTFGIGKLTGSATRRCTCCVPAVVTVTRMDCTKPPVAVGLPFTSPVAELKFIPLGRLFTDHVFVPGPVAVKV
jgi:hypothetical protein